MRAFVDFEASSLAREGYPIEVGWVFEHGTGESHLIRPAQGWDDWDAKAEAIHGIDRALLLREGEAADVVAQRMIAALAGATLYASAPSWDGKWLSALLRAAGLPRHSLRLRDTEEAQADIASDILRDVVPAEALAAVVETITMLADMRARPDKPAHRALADARGELTRWQAVRDAALAEAARRRG